MINPIKGKSYLKGSETGVVYVYLGWTSFRPRRGDEFRTEHSPMSGHHRFMKVTSKESKPEIVSFVYLNGFREI